MRSDKSREEWMKFIPRGARLTHVVNFQTGLSIILCK